MNFSYIWQELKAFSYKNTVDSALLWILKYDKFNVVITF